MNTNALAVADALPDRELLARLETLATSERQTCAELIAHLAALDERRSLYLAAGYGSLFAYCREALRLSEDATCARTDVARICRKFPIVLGHLASGELSLTTARLIGHHLTPENQHDVLRRARGRTRRDVEVLVAELSPQPAVPSTVRRLPTPATTATPLAASASVPSPDTTGAPVAAVPAAPTAAVLPPAGRPSIQPTAPGHYRFKLDVGQETHDKLRRLQTLLRPEIPTGDPAAIVDRALALLLAKVEKQKCGAAATIRPGTDKTAKETGESNPRTIPRWVRRAVWRRDQGRCAFVSSDGRRCTETHFLQYHHIIPWALGGRATIDNISLRCRSHNQYEADLVFGPQPRRADRNGRRDISSGASVTTNVRPPASVP
jgi:5-methylcytosine-specific restriction endonuclease McrA